MPTADRKPRARRRTTRKNPITNAAALHAAILTTQHDADAWETERTRVARFLLRRVKDSDRALRIADIFHRRPELMPMPPPKRCQ